MSGFGKQKKYYTKNYSVQRMNNAAGSTYPTGTNNGGYGGRGGNLHFRNSGNNNSAVGAYNHGSYNSALGGYNHGSYNNNQYRNQYFATVSSYNHNIGYSSHESSNYHQTEINQFDYEQPYRIFTFMPLLSVRNVHPFTSKKDKECMESFFFSMFPKAQKSFKKKKHGSDFHVVNELSWERKLEIREKRIKHFRINSKHFIGVDRPKNSYPFQRGYYYFDQTTGFFSYTKFNRYDNTEKKIDILWIPKYFLFEYINFGNDFVLCSNPFVYHMDNEKFILFYRGQIVTHRISEKSKFRNLGYDYLRMFSHNYGKDVLIFRAEMLSSFHGSKVTLFYKKRKSIDSKDSDMVSLPGNFMSYRSVHGKVNVWRDLSALNRMIKPFCDIATKLWAIRDEDIMRDYSRVCRNSFLKRVLSYDVSRYPNFKFRKYSRVFQRFIINLLFLNRLPRCLLFKISKDVLLYVIIPFISEESVFLGDSVVSEILDTM